MSEEILAVDTGRSLMLPEAMQREIVEHAIAELPRECCGVIAGEAGRAVALHRLTNLDQGTEFYRIDDTEVFQLWRSLDEAGQEILVVYHSHPTSPARPSRQDVELASWPEAFYLICSLMERDRPDLRAFRIVDGAVTEVGLRAS